MDRVQQATEAALVVAADALRVETRTAQTLRGERHETRGPRAPTP
jgi:hypothetical protein